MSPSAARPAHAVRLAALLPLLALAAACRNPGGVAPCPLDPDAALARVRTARQEVAPSGGLPLAEAADLLRRHNPRVRTALAEGRAAARVAATRTPLPNPTIEVSPLMLYENVFESISWGVDAALGWAIPLSSARCLQDDLNAVRAQAAAAEAQAVEREEYLALRGEYVAARLAEDLLRARGEQEQAARDAAQVAEQAVLAGSATGLDARLLDLEAAEVAAERFESEEALADARAALASRLGVALPDGRSPSEVPTLPAEMPPPADLDRAVIAHHPRLASLRAEYLVAEKELRLEAVRWIPSLGVGLSYEREGDNKLGLPLGIEIPVFDRNQPAIAEALGRREALRERFEAELNRILGETAQARARLLVRQRRLALADAQVAPAEEADRLAESSLQSGAVDMLRYLEVRRAARRLRIERLEAAAAVHEAWAGLEAAAGAPLRRFPGEDRTTSAKTAQGDAR